ITAAVVSLTAAGVAAAAAVSPAHSAVAIVVDGTAVVAARRAGGSTHDRQREQGAEKFRILDGSRVHRSVLQPSSAVGHSKVKEKAGEGLLPHAHLARAHGGAAARSGEGSRGRMRRAQRPLARCSMTSIFVMIAIGCSASNTTAAFPSL